MNLSHTKTWYFLLRQLVPFIILFYSFNFSNAQIVSLENYTGHWLDSASWQGGAYPGTNISDTDLTCNGFLSAYNCIEFDKGILTITDTLIIYGNLNLKNNAEMHIESTGILVVLGKYTSNNQVVVQNEGLFVATGEFTMLGSDNQGKFVNLGKLFIFDSLPTLKEGVNYADLACTSSNIYPTYCGFGNETDLINDASYPFITRIPDYNIYKDSENNSCTFASFTVNKETACLNDTLRFNNTSVVNNLTPLYSWDFGEDAISLTDASNKQQLVLYTTGGEKIISLSYIEDGKKYSYNDTIYISEPSDNFTIEGTNRCGAGPLNISIQSIDNVEMDFSLDQGNLIVFSDSEAPYEYNIEILEGEIVNLFVRSTDKKTGCESQWAQTIVQSYPNPVTGQMSVAKSSNDIYMDVLCTNSSNTYQVNGDENSSYNWYLNGHELALNSLNTIEINWDGNEDEYMLSVQEISEMGCIGTISMNLIKVEDCSEGTFLDQSIYAFTPNNDLINDYWEIEAIDQFPLAKISVFDRFGTRVFHSPGDYQNDWDGTFNGKILPIDSYHFIIDLSAYNRPYITGIVTVLK